MSSLTTRIKTRLHRDTLDEKLAYGASPAATPELLLRSRQLMAPASREHLADKLKRIVRQAEQQWPPAGAEIVPLRHPAIRACAPELASIVRRLHETEGLGVRGVAMAARLVSDGTSPLYTGGRGDLTQRVRSIRLALDVTAPVEPVVAEAQAA
jgi:hypothetical protein